MYRVHVQLFGKLKVPHVNTQSRTDALNAIYTETFLFQLNGPFFSTANILKGLNVIM